MNTEDRNKKAKAFWENAGELVCSLTGRWADESEYEDINDYKVPLQKLADKYDITIKSMLKRPFGCKFVVNGAKTVVYKLTMALSGDYRYKRIK